MFDSLAQRKKIKDDALHVKVDDQKAILALGNVKQYELIKLKKDQEERQKVV